MIEVFYLKIQYHFENVVCKFLKVAIYVYSDEVQTPSIQDQKTQDGRSVEGLHGIFSLIYSIKPSLK